MEQPKDRDERLEILRETRNRAILARDEEYQRAQRLKKIIQELEGKLAESEQQNKNLIISQQKSQNREKLLNIIILIVSLFGIGMVIYPNLSPENPRMKKSQTKSSNTTSGNKTKPTIQDPSESGKSELSQNKQDPKVQVEPSVKDKREEKKYFSELIPTDADEEIKKIYDNINSVLKNSLFNRYKIIASNRDNANFKTKIMIKKIGVDSIELTINFYQQNDSRLQLSNGKSFLEVKESKRNLLSEISKISLK